MILLNCPYCNVVLPKEPDRKTKCKNCGKFYYKRDHPNSRYDYKIVTEEEAKSIDDLWLKINTAHTRLSSDRQEIEQLYKKLDQIREFLKMAGLLGAVSIGGEKVTIFELEEMESELIRQITEASDKLKLRWANQ